MDRKFGSVPPLGGGWELGLHLTQGHMGRRYLHTKWHLNPFSRLATTDGPKIGWYLCPLLGKQLGPHLTQCGLGRVYLHAMFNFDPSNVWQQYTNVTDRQARQDNGPIA